MKYSMRVLRKRFEAERSKDAYLNACEWLAKNVLSKEDEVGEFMFGIKKVKEAENPTFELSLYVSLEESNLNKQMCDACKQVHTLFYVGADTDCDRCRAGVYRKRMDEGLRIKAQYMKEKLKRVL